MRYSDCTNNGDCPGCSLSSYGRDCHNSPINQIAYLRSNAGLSQQQLAKKSGVNIRQIQRIENGESSIGNVTLSNAIRIADALGVDVKELLA